jgi:hypothetical protein
MRVVGGRAANVWNVRRNRRMDQEREPLAREPTKWTFSGMNHEAKALKKKITTS